MCVCVRVYVCTYTYIVYKNLNKYKEITWVFQYYMHVLVYKLFILKKNGSKQYQKGFFGL